ncbi:DUF4862 family protein [Pseudarthrobacter sp. PH31-O2]|uniref:DUF4862 family protein n=1 Tax=Micrococcaceae TaxID=1268 RepID=UPI0024BAA848|nr:DUF4862 family protein [Pseudarthrobacter sp. PH31-O2]
MANPPGDVRSIQIEGENVSLIVGAYPAQPEGLLQSQFFEELAALAAIRGLELPYRAWGGDPWPAGANADWSAVVTAIPGTMQRAGADARFGLASTDREGRRAAVDFTAGILGYVAGLRDQGHRVEAVALHSAPSGHGTPAAFAESLWEILGWDWQGTSLVVEHCDAPRPGRVPEKGFLSFSDETNLVRAFREQGQDIGMLVNWARSVIETGQRRTAAVHVAEAREAGVLNGLMFSGCSPEATEFGYPWIDAHLPAVEVEGAPASSLLTTREIAGCLREAGRPPIIGLKIGLPGAAASPLERAARVRQMCDLVMANVG